MKVWELIKKDSWPDFWLKVLSIGNELIIMMFSLWLWRKNPFRC